MKLGPSVLFATPFWLCAVGIPEENESVSLTRITLAISLLLSIGFLNARCAS